MRDDNWPDELVIPTRISLRSNYSALGGERVDTSEYRLELHPTTGELTLIRRRGGLLAGDWEALMHQRDYLKVETVKYIRKPEDDGQGEIISYICF